MTGRGALQGKRLLLGVSGSIAAYKAVEFLRALQERGAAVQVVMTRNAGRFVSALTFETLSGSSVPHPEFQDRELPGVGHIELTRGIDAAIVAPATANSIGKLAAGIADDTLSTVLLALDCPLVVAPAMNDKMYAHPAVRSNIAVLRQRGVRFVEPGTGALACGTVGQGRLASTEELLTAVMACFPVPDLAGLTVLITAGPTREPIDAVRFISNPSTGKMGFALAAAAAARGADTILVTGPAALAPPPGVTAVPVVTAAQMHQAVLEHIGKAQIVIMAAAVSDFRPRTSSPRKIKKQDAPDCVELERTEDILAAVGRMQGRRLLVGFAAESDDVTGNAARKLRDKNLDLILANDILQEGAGFGADTNSVIMIERSGRRTDLPLMTKHDIASRILDKVVELRKA